MWNISGQVLRFGLLIALGLSLTGCLTTNELINTAATTGAATVSAAAGLPVIPTAILTATAGVTAGVVTEEPEPPAPIPTDLNPWSAMAQAFRDLLDHAFEVVIAVSVGVLGIPMLISFIVGKVMPNRKTKEVEQENKVLKKLMEK